MKLELEPEQPTSCAREPASGDGLIVFPRGALQVERVASSGLRADLDQRPLLVFCDAADHAVHTVLHLTRLSLDTLAWRHFGALLLLLLNAGVTRTLYVYLQPPRGVTAGRRLSLGLSLM